MSDNGIEVDDVVLDEEHIVRMFASHGVDREDVRALPPNMGYGPADLAAVPAELAAEDAPNQSAVLEGIGFQSSFRHDLADDYKKLTTYSRNLSWYQRMYNDRNSSAALSSLSQKLRLKIDDDLQVSIDDERLVIEPGHVSLDYECVVSRHYFDGVLPTSGANFDWVFSLELNQCFRTWDQRKAMLGVDAAGRMLNIGFTGESQYWLLMCPDEALKSGYQPVAAGLHTNSSRMETADWLRMVAFIAYCLATLAIDDTTMINMYPDVTSRETIARSTNIFLRKSRKLNLTRTRRLSAQMARHWPSYRDSAPESWVRDSAIWSDSTPVIVAINVGQDTTICDHPKYIAERAAWRERLNYPMIRYMTVALASHLRFFLVDKDQWVDVSDEEIMEEIGMEPIYNSPDPDSRQPIEDLADYPLRDETGKINKLELYDRQGHRIHRRKPREGATRRRVGVLYDLDAVRRTFSGGEQLSPGIHGDPHTREDQLPVEHYLYPHFFSTSIGQWQAQGAYPTLHHSVRNVNEEICAAYEHMPAELILRRAVWIVSSQGYSLLAHRYRFRGGRHHDVQKGRITSFAAGTHAVSASAVRVFDNIRVSLQNGLPHQDFAQKISTDVPSNLPPWDTESPEGNLEMDPRQEVVYVIHFDRIPEENRDGAYVYDKIIYPLGTSWTSWYNLRALKKTLFVFAPDVFPAIYNVMTFPLTCALEVLYEEIASEWHMKQTPYPPAKVELLSCIERSLNYGHTGNTRVIASALMNRLWVGLSLLQHGLPMFSSACHFATRAVSINVDHYPLHETTRVPYTASDRSQLITYGPQQCLLYKSKFAMHMLALHPPANAFPEIKDSSVRRAAVVAEYVVKGLISDLVTFVLESTDAVLKAANAQRDAARGEFTTIDCEERRRRAMEEWKRRPSPFDHDSVAVHLARIVSPRATAATGLPHDGASARTMSSAELSEHLHTIAAANPTATFGNTTVIRKGIAHSSLVAALTLMRGMVPEKATEEAKETAVKSLFVHVVRVCLIKHKLKAVPWGRCKPSYDNWVRIRDTANEVPALDVAELTAAEKDERTGARNAQEAYLADATSPWNMGDLALDQIAAHANRLVPPTDFRITETKVNSLSLEVYAQFDIRNPIHRYCLFVAWFVSRMCPMVHWDTVEVGRIQRDKRVRSTEELTRIIKSLQWVTPGGSKGIVGVRDGTTYWREATVYMIGMVWKESAVMQDAMQPVPLESLGKGGKGPYRGPHKDWTSKYTDKRMGPILLVRVGLAEPLTNGMFHKPEWLKAARAKPQEQLERDARDFFATLATPTYGVFDTFVRLVGVENAVRICAGGVPIRPQYRGHSAVPIQGIPPADGVSSSSGTSSSPASSGSGAWV